MGRVLSKLENYPIGICGTSVAFITLSNCWALNGIKFLKPIAVAFAICAISLMLLRVVLFPEKILQEIKHPILGSFYPTIDMACFLIAASFLKVAPTFSKVLWLTCIITHGVLFVVFFAFRLKDFKIKDMVPSWFVVLIGVVVGSVTSVGMGHDKLAQYLFDFGFFWYAVSWPIMLLRVWKGEKIEEKNLPTIGIMAAPGSLCVVGYLTVFQNPNKFILGFLIVTSIFNLILVYTYIAEFIRKGFKPTYAALTFPLAISILAMYKVSMYINTIGAFGGNIFKVLGHIEIFIGTYVIFYVIHNFLKLFLSAINPKTESGFEKEEGLLGETMGEEVLPEDLIEEELV